MASLELQSSIKTGGVELSNRVVLSPLLLAIATEGGEVTQEVIDFYGARARGGVGLIITGGAFVAGTGRLYDRVPKITHDRYIPGWRSLVEAVHKQGAKIAIQLAHGGIRVRSALTGEQPAGPSSISAPDLSEAPRELSRDEIQGMVAAFGEAAKRAKEAGFNGIELHCSGALLIHQFLSPYSNRRTDEYGGSFENRFRFALEVIHEVRKNVGSELFIGCRIPHDEIVPGGLTLEDTGSIAVEMVKAGIDCVRLVVGVTPPRGREDSQRTSTSRPEGQLPMLSRLMKEVVTVPVIATGGINTIEQAERLIKEGDADLVAIGQALLADAYWLQHSPEYIEMFPGFKYCPKCGHKV
ncbi:NADH:flavin oxidoreductase [Chloroflexota bacterium]